MNLNTLLGCLAILSLGVGATPAAATAIGTANIHLDWSSLSVSAGPELTMAFDPILGGRFSNVAFLGVSQGELNGVAVPYDELAPFNSSYLQFDSPNSITYSRGNSISRIGADLASDGQAASLQQTAFDDDGNLFTGNFINAYAGRRQRLIVSGTGTLTVSFDYSMDLAASGIAGSDFARSRGNVSLGFEHYEPNDIGGWTFLGTSQTSILEDIESNDTLSRNGTLTLTQAFDDATNHLFLIEMNAFATTIANSYVGGSVVVPEPESLSLVLTGVGLVGMMRRRRRN